MRSILFLADRPGVHDDGRSTGPFLDRVASLGFGVQLVCIEAGGEVEDDPRVVASPGLGRRWQQPLAVRGLRFGERLVRPDLLHVLQESMSETGLAIAEHWKVPYIATVDEFLRPGGRLRVSRRWCRKLIATSRELAEELREELGVPSSLLAEIHPGIDAPEEEPSRPSGRGVSVVGTAGPLVASSGFGTFLNAVKRVIEAGVDVEFVIAGQGEDEVDLRRRADRLRIADRVTFASIPVLGPRFWSVLDLYCQPSLSPSVGRPLATALAFGVPAIASDIEGLRALVVPGRSGVRVPPGDSGALSAAIQELLADRGRAAALGAEGRALIRREYAPEVEASRLAVLYSEALAPAAPTGVRPALLPG